jgi:DNA excision repair protein ERCC-6
LEWIGKQQPHRHEQESSIKTKNVHGMTKQEPPQKKFKRNDKYWVGTNGSTIHQDEDNEMNLSCVQTLLGLDDESPWMYEPSTDEVVLKELSQSVRLPLSLFKKLFTYQRVGVDWMACLYKKKIGGILADEPGYVWITLTPCRVPTVCIILPKTDSSLIFVFLFTEWERPFKSFPFC